MSQPNIATNSTSKCMAINSMCHPDLITGVPPGAAAAAAAAAAATASASAFGAAAATVIASKHTRSGTGTAKPEARADQGISTYSFSFPTTMQIGSINPNPSPNGAMLGGNSGAQAGATSAILQQVLLPGMPQHAPSLFQQWNQKLPAGGHGSGSSCDNEGG
jgi:hypothetical protein